MSKIAIVTAPSGDVVSVSDFRSHARMTHKEDDDTLQKLLDVATEAVEEYTWRKLLTQTWDQYFDAFGTLRLQYPPLSSVASGGVTYVDADGVTQTVSTDVWETGEDEGIGIVRLKYNQTWPSKRAHKDTVIVRFVCGYGDPDDVPESIRQAIRLHAMHQYRHRGSEPVPDAFYRLLDMYVSPDKPAMMYVGG